MSTKSYFDGTVSQPTGNYRLLPRIDEKKLTSPEHYMAGPDLQAAVNVALTLGMPLLLTGAPGCGKSELARRIAWELDFPKVETDAPDKAKHRPEQLLKFVVKSTTEARDLFYTYDTVGRFHAAQVAGYLAEKERSEEKAEKAEEVDGQRTRLETLASDPANFIEYQALGLAILRAKQRTDLPTGIVRSDQLDQFPSEPCRSLVLIDEIDKAQRDVPNDILNEIEHMEFTIPELGGKRIRLNDSDQQHRPVVIITSNSERDLPQAFLRRCVYYHLAFPPFAVDMPQQPGDKSNQQPVTIERIVTSRLGERFLDDNPLMREALRLCRFLRRENLGLIKQPSLAEILNYLSYLEKVTTADPKSVVQRLDELPAVIRQQGMMTTLLKNREDQIRASDLYQQWKDDDRKAQNTGLAATR